MKNTLSKDDEKRLRKVLLLCCHTVRNAAYYEMRGFRHRSISTEFWNTADGNFLDICILEWSKIFADKKGKHHWHKVVIDHSDFLAALQAQIDIDEEDLQNLVQYVKNYRDKFVAHLDDDDIMHIPYLLQLRASAAFLYSYLTQLYPEFIAGTAFPSSMTHYLDYSRAEARAVYKYFSRPFTPS